jgi:hypothetical protein
MSLMRNNDIKKGKYLNPLGLRFLNFREVKDFLENFDFIENGFLLRYKKLIYGNKKIQFINNELCSMELIIE